MIKIIIWIGLALMAAYMAMEFWPAAGPARGGAAKVIIEKPLTETPMGEATKLFKRLSSDKAGVFFWHAPKVKKGSLLPLVVVFHGAPGFSYAASYLVTPEVQAKHPAYILVPTTAKTAWHNPEKMKGVVGLITDIVKRYPVDLDRIYAIGCSQGGTGVYAALLYYPQVFAAGIPISGDWRVSDAPKFKNMPMWIINAANDTVIPPGHGRQIAAKAQSLGAPVFYSELQDMGHDCPSEKFYTAHTWQWLFAQKKRAAP